MNQTPTTGPTNAPADAPAHARTDASSHAHPAAGTDSFPAATRRSVLAGMLGALAVAGGGLAGCAGAQGAGGGRDGGGRSAGGRRGRVARIAHLTDMHVQPERGADQGFIQCLKHVHALADKPDLILTGGDLIFSSYEKDRARTQLQWDLFTGAMREHCTIPVRHCLGNHDIWGWNKASSGTTGSEPGWGKAWASELLGVPKWYYAEDFGSWKLIVLDSVQAFDDTRYQGRVDDEQFAWLERELAATQRDKPVIVATHIPVFHASTILVDTRPTPEGRRIGVGAIMTNCGRVSALLAAHPNVRAVLQGHIHMIERIEYQGIAWINSGAVSGGWWRSPAGVRQRLVDRNDTSEDLRPDRATPGYGLVDLYADGRVDWQYMEYGWTPRDAD